MDQYIYLALEILAYCCTVVVNATPTDSYQQWATAAPFESYYTNNGSIYLFSSCDSCLRCTVVVNATPTNSTPMASGGSSGGWGRGPIQNPAHQWPPLDVSKLCNVKQHDLIKACFIVHRTHGNDIPTHPKTTFMRSCSSKNVSWVSMHYKSPRSNMNIYSKYSGYICISVLKCLSFLFLDLVSETKSSYTNVT